MRLPRLIVKAGAGLALALAVTLFLAPNPARADIEGPCTATGFASTSGGAIHSFTEASKAHASTFDITNDYTWHVTDDQVLSGIGTATPEQTQGHAEATAFGISLTIASGSGHGHDGSGGPIKVKDIATFTDRVVITGGSDSCSGAIVIVVDGKNPATTVAGGGGLALGVLGAAGTAAVALRRRPI